MPQATDPSAEVAPGIPPPENKVFYPALDGLRAIAVLMVFASHYLNDVTPVPLRWGWTGVDIFFVLSGFLITGILYDTKDSLHRYRNFYARRTLRIFPLYYGVLVGIVLLGPIFQWSWNYAELLWTVYLGNYVSFIHTHLSMWRNFTLVSRRTGVSLMIEHLWSLSVEEQFYLVWPLVIFSVRDRRRLIKISLIVIGVVPLLRLLAQIFSPPQLLNADFLYRATPFRVDALLIGGAVALLLRGSKADLIRKYATPFLGFAFAAMLFTWVFVGSYLTRTIVPRFGPAWVAALGFTFIDLVAAALLVLSLEKGSLLYRLLSVRPLRRLGQVSYGFYVFHELPHSYYQVYLHRYYHGSITQTYLITALIAFVCTLILSYLSFRFYEAPFLRLKDRFTV